MRARYACTSACEVTVPADMAAASSGMTFSSTSNDGRCPAGARLAEARLREGWAGAMTSRPAATTPVSVATRFIGRSYPSHRASAALESTTPVQTVRADFPHTAYQGAF
jgi:hypothetical protein